MQTTMNLALTSLEKAVAHRVGNKHDEGSMIISDTEIPVHSGLIGELLHTYFLKPFTTPEFFKFTFTNEDFKLNPLFQFCADIFDDPERLMINSVHIAKHLYELSNHPNIKSGDLFVAYFRNAVINDEPKAAVGIFKSENKQKFLKIDEEGGGLRVDADAGISIDKLDKGCIIFESEKDDGYRILALDRTNRGQNARYWTEDFLRITPCVDSYYLTRELMNETRMFVVENPDSEVTLNRADQIDLLNKSAEYFKEKEQFDREDFEETVFKEPELIDAYRKFTRTAGGYDEDRDDAPAFDISSQAVKKFGKVYKSVLKLDKNFHVYIHGDRSLIEQGRDSDGRKYYKLYYEDEA